MAISLMISTAGSAQPSAGSTEKSLPSECLKLRELAHTQGDASPIITACISSLPDHATLRLSPGQYHLRTPLMISRPITIETAALNPARACRNGDSNGCAVLILEEMLSPRVASTMPIEIEASDVTLRAIAVTGNNTRNADWERQVCLANNTRPLGGGIRVRGSGFRLQDALIRNVRCHSALEIVASAGSPNIFDSTIGPNGTHDVHLLWADGVTIHDTHDARVEGNLFLDNTDVQLIFGGCRDCIVSGNIFRHSAAFAQASFAELMIHAWPNTSGNFTGSTISQNDIDCGKAKRCGYGIMIGGEPWYSSKTFGGTVSNNHIDNASLALNVDLLTGPMTITNNRISRSGGIANSDCGRKTWPAVNISPPSLKLVRTDIRDFASMSTAKCIVLRQP
jgi:hypothetical protein